MSLVWKLLRQHISIPQFIGFFFANLFGMLIVLLGFQFYRDVLPVFTAEDSFMKSDYLIMNNMSVNGVSVVNHSEISFESIPDEFIDIPLKDWKYKQGDKVVPIILPRIYLTMYNFGFAQSHSLPKISDGLMGMIDFQIFIHGNGHQDQYKGKVIGFSSRLSSILVPQAFMDWSNNYYSTGDGSEPTRLIVDASNPADEHISQYIEKKGYEIEDSQLNAEKTTYFLKLMVTMVMIVGLVISILSFYILMLSIYLLVQKNSSKLENLLLIGYKPGQVARPYQLLTIGLNLGVLLISWLVLYFVRQYYMDIIESLFPNIEDGNMLPAVGMGIVLFVLVSVCNLIAIKHKIVRIWKRKE